MTIHKIKINRAPVLARWAVIVAERLGYDRDAALTLGKAVAGLNVQFKSRSLGIFKPREKLAEKEKERKKGEEFSVGLFVRTVTVVQTEAGIRASIKGKATEPQSVERYLRSKFVKAKLGEQFTYLFSPRTVLYPPVLQNPDARSKSKISCVHCNIIRIISRDILL